MAIANYCFLDIESKKNSTDFVGAPNDGWGESVPSFLDPTKELTKANFFQMGFGMACTYDNKGVKFWNDPGELLVYLLDSYVDAIVSFNGEGCDFNILLGELDPPEKKDQWSFSDGFKEAYTGLHSKSIDVLKEVERTLGHRLKLDQITSALFEVQKEFDGKTWWSMFTSAGIIQRTKAINYLLSDVFQLYQIYGVASELGQLAYRDNLGNTKKFEIKIKTVNDITNESTSPY